MKELTSKNVSKVFEDCLFRDNEIMEENMKYEYIDNSEQLLVKITDIQCAREIIQYVKQLKIKGYQDITMVFRDCWGWGEKSEEEEFLNKFNKYAILNCPVCGRNKKYIYIGDEGCYPARELLFHIYKCDYITIGEIKKLILQKRMLTNLWKERRGDNNEKA